MVMITEEELNDLDLKIRDLVLALCEIDVVLTQGSCQGHANPLPDIGQSAGWYVSFDVPANRKGWKALHLLGFGISEYADMFDSDARIILWSDVGDIDGKGARFEMEGTDADDIEPLSVRIRMYHRRLKNSLSRRKADDTSPNISTARL